MPYKKQPCKICGKPIQYIYSRNEFNHTGLCRQCYLTQVQNEKLEAWLKTGIIPIQVQSSIKEPYRSYILRQQNNKCAICHITNEWNDKPLVFVLDHIDGDATNNVRTNLRLTYPNCDSQLDTFKSKNKNSKRSFRRQSSSPSE